MQFPKKTSEYEDLKELTEPWGSVYGPIQSRRLGKSLGINLLGADEKICSFDCVYCEIGRTTLKMSQIKQVAKFPPVSEIEENLRLQIVHFTKKKVKIDSLTFVGNGEPTLYPDFQEAVETVIKVRNELLPTAKVGILSNGSLLDNNKVIRALNLLDDRMIKLDAGNDEMLGRLNGPLVRTGVSKIIQRTKKLKDVIIQSLFLQGKIDNTIPNEVDDWIESIGLIKPKLVHIYTLDRVPATSGLKAPPHQKLKEISLALQKRTGIKAVVFVS